MHQFSSLLMLVFIWVTRIPPTDPVNTRQATNQINRVYTSLSDHNEKPSTQMEAVVMTTGRNGEAQATG